jgi:hypothetical protein
MENITETGCGRKCGQAIEGSATYWQSFIRFWMMRYGTITSIRSQRHKKMRRKWEALMVFSCASQTVTKPPQS